MRRRRFLAGLGATALGAGTYGTTNHGAVSAELTGGTDSRVGSAQEEIEQLQFYSGGSLLNASEEPLEEQSLVAVWTEPSATNVDEDGNGDVVSYDAESRIPVACVDGTVAGFGAPLVTDDNGDFKRGNEQFLLNVWDELTPEGGDGLQTVLWDEGHDQFYTASKYQQFANYARSNGYDVSGTTSVTDGLSDAAAVVITSPSAAFEDEELTALENFVAEGGAVFLHDQSDFRDFDETGNMNAIAEGLGVGFRFNDDQVIDSDHPNDDGDAFGVLTTQFNEEDHPAFFEGRPGIGAGPKEFDLTKAYSATVTSVSDGDTLEVKFDDGTVSDVRVLGVDTPESPVATQAERPEEWEGVAYDYRRAQLNALTFDSTCSLLDPDETPLTDDELVAVWAEASAQNQDADGNGDAVSYSSDADIPLVAVDGAIAGLGAPLVADPEDGNGKFQGDNEEFVLNLMDTVVGAPGEDEEKTILWDEGHDQFYTFDKFQQFGEYARRNGYAVVRTSSLTDQLAEADAAVVTSPSAAFAGSELDALSSFVDDGGSLLMIDQADFDDFDATANINEIASTVGAGFRFNDDQVIDPSRNAGEDFIPTTANFNTDAFSVFADRPGIDDGAVGGTTDYLVEWGNKASTFGRKELSNRSVTITFDEGEGARDAFGRLLAYVEYGDGKRYNDELLKTGHARVYDSGLSRHDELHGMELQARADGVGLWAKSDVDGAPSWRNRAVDDCYFPNTSTVRTTDGALSAERAPVYAPENATQYAGDGVAYEEQAPLVGVDVEAGVAMAGAPLIDDEYERLSGFPEDVGDFENYVLLANLLDALSDTDGDVYVDGGHGQFATEFAVSAESAAFFGRYLEGQGMTLEQTNAITTDRLSDAKALIVCSPTEALSESELEALASFRDDGGAVLFLGSSEADVNVRENVASAAEALGTDLRLNGDQVIDQNNNLAGDRTLVTTASTNDRFEGVLGAYDGSATLPEAVTGTPTPTRTASPTPESTPTPTETLEPDTEAAAGGASIEQTTSDSGPGFGAAAAVTALSGVAWRLLRQDDDQQ